MVEAYAVQQNEHDDQFWKALYALAREMADDEGSSQFAKMPPQHKATASAVLEGNAENISKNHSENISKALHSTHTLSQNGWVGRKEKENRSSCANTCTL